MLVLLIWHVEWINKGSYSVWVSAALGVKFSLLTHIHVCMYTPEQFIACQRLLLRSVSTLVFEHVPVHIHE